MLVISRKKGESVLIGDGIEITIIGINENSVKVAIAAPKDVSILRKELYNEVKAENIRATNFNVDILKNIKK